MKNIVKHLLAIALGIAIGTCIDLGYTSVTTTSAANPSDNIVGGSINNTPIGATTPSTGAFTTLTTSGTTTLSPANANVVLSPTGTGVVTVNPATAGTLNNVVIGGTTPLAGTFTTLTASSTIQGTASGGAVGGKWIGRASDNGFNHLFYASDGTTLRAVIGYTNTELAIDTETGVPINLYYSASKKAAVSSTGFDVTGLLTSSGGLKGTTTNDNATALNVGEYQEVNCGIPAASGGSVAFTSASPTVGTWTSHPFRNTGVAYGSYACPFTITATAPTGLSTSTNYWATPIDANTFHVSTSAANAAAGTWANTSGSTSTSNLTNSIALSTTAGLSPAVLLLTAGDWDCSGQAIRVLGATTSVTNMQTGINSSSTAVGGLGTYFDFESAANVMTATNSPIHSTPTVRISLASTTAEYLVALDTFTASTNTVSGFLRCRRMR